ncbi:HNH endonuclease [Streptomyces sp. NPDC056632]|uniref:HNH endonuclease n=1 Tax=Streptomyces sp. NPDC056632 TaxID=3345884 RepID=UPI003698F661
MSRRKDRLAGSKRFPRNSYDQPRSKGTRRVDPGGNLTRRVDPGIALRYAVKQTRDGVARAEWALANAERTYWGTDRSTSDAATLNRFRNALNLARTAHLTAVEELRLWEDGNRQGEYVVDAPTREALSENPEQPVNAGALEPETPWMLTPSTPAADVVLPAKAAKEYRRLVELVESREASRYGVRAQRTIGRALRDDAARKAVLLRAGGRCENPACGGQPEDVDDEGEAILEVDHIREIARGGRDHPMQLSALCPNCHAMKGRGRNRETLREVLLEVAREAHTAWSSAPTSP